MTAPIGDLHLLSPKKMALEKKSTSNVVDVHNSPIKDSDLKGEEVEEDIVIIRPST